MARTRRQVKKRKQEQAKARLRKQIVYGVVKKSEEPVHTTVKKTWTEWQNRGLVRKAIDWLRGRKWGK